jgi:hypothetical protein
VWQKEHYEQSMDKRLEMVGKELDELRTQAADIPKIREKRWISTSKRQT